MKWLSKALVFKALSTIPGGNSIYRHAQSHLTKSIVATPIRVAQKIDIGIQYLSWLMNHDYDAEAIRSLRHLDLGCGWHPTIPVLYSALGLRRQILTDVYPLLTSQTFHESVNFVNQHLKDYKDMPVGFLFEKIVQTLPSNTTLNEQLNHCGMEYIAPYSEWGKETDTRVDLVTCTQVLMHIERPILDQVFKLVYDLLTPGGLFMNTVHLFDIYSNSDSRISIYNHLKYSKNTWSHLVNSEMMTFNRYKARDYREALEGAGFEIIDFDIDHGDADDLRTLRSIKIHPEFTARYSEEELADKHLFFVVRKP